MPRIGLALVLVLLVTGCASMPKLSSADATRVKSGNSAVLFVDDVEQITYLQDKYYVLAVTQEGSTSVYKGIWNSGKDVSKVQADEFAKIGLQAKSAYDVLGESDLASLADANKDRFTLRPQQPAQKSADKKSSGAPAKTITPELRQALLDRGQEFLIWTSWSGYTLHIQTLGLPPNEQFVQRYWIFDLKKDQMLGGGDVVWMHSVDLAGQTGKEFLERDNLAGFRSQVEKQMRARFTDPPKFTIGKVLGLESAS